MTTYITNYFNVSQIYYFPTNIAVSPIDIKTVKNLLVSTSVYSGVKNLSYLEILNRLLDVNLKACNYYPKYLKGDEIVFFNLKTPMESIKEINKKTVGELDYQFYLLTISR